MARRTGSCPARCGRLASCRGGLSCDELAVRRCSLNLPALHAFLTELKFNNEKSWFDANRGRYQSLRQEFIAFMGGVIQGVARTDLSVEGVRAQDTLFRINRDVRFAHDKSPYKATFSAAISPVVPCIAPQQRGGLGQGYDGEVA